MIILNQDKINLKYHTDDNLIFEINSNSRIEDILEMLKQGKPLEDIGGFQAYYVSHKGEEINPNDIDKDFIDTAYSIYQKREESSFIPDYNVVHDSEYEGDVDTGDEYHAEHYQTTGKEPFLVTREKELKKDFENFLFNVTTTSKVYGINSNTEGLREALINQLACSINIIPQLLEYYPDKSVNELKKISMITELAIDTSIADYYGKDYYQLIPSKETIDILNKLSNAERQLLDKDNCIMNPTKAVDICVKLKKDNPNIYLTKDLIESYYYKHIDDYVPTKAQIKLNDNINVNSWREAINTAKELFENSSKHGKRSPGVLEEYVAAQKNKNSRITGNEIFNKFNLKNLQKVAKSKSEVLYALCDELNYLEMKQSHLDILAASYPKVLIPYLKNNGFVEFYKKNKDMSDENLRELLDKYRNVYEYAMEIKRSIDSGEQHYASSRDYDISGLKFNLNNTVEEQIQELYSYKAIQDCKAMESKYNYKFEDNDLAIKGRNIEIRQGNLRMYMLSATDLRNFTTGYDTNCCQHYDGAGESCVYKLTSDPYAGNVVIEKNKKVIAQGFVWTDEAKDTIVFDNVEFNNDRDVHLFNNIFSAWCKEMPYANVHCGSGYNPGMQGWGKKVRNTVIMPTTISNKYTYTDYHDNARCLKENDKVVLPEAYNYTVIEHELIPSKYDIINNLNLSYLVAMGLSIDKVIEYGQKIESNTLTEDEIKELITNSRDHKTLLSKFGTLSDDLQVWFYEKYPRELEYITNPCQRIAELQIVDNPKAIVNIENPSEQLQIDVVKKDGLLIKLIKNPCDAALLEAVKQNGFALQVINQARYTDELVLEAIKASPKIILSVKHPSDVCIKEALLKEPQLLGLVEQFTPVSTQIKEDIIRETPNTILSIRNPEYDLIKLSVQCNGLLIRNFQKQYPELKEIALTQNPLAIRVIQNPTVEDCVLAIQGNPEAAKYIRNSELVAQAQSIIEGLRQPEDLEFELDGLENM